MPKKISKQPFDLNDRLDEQSKAVLEMMPAELLDLSDIPKARLMVDGLMAAMFEAAPDIPGVKWKIIGCRDRLETRM